MFAHGSSVETANESVRAVTAEAARVGGFPLMDTAFLECARPDLPEAVAKMVAEGAGRILVIPYFLTMGIHLRRDLPRIADDLMRRHPGVAIEVTEPLDGHPALPQIVVERAQKAL